MALARVVRAFLPLSLFFVCFAGAGVGLGDFYALPGSVAMIPAMVLAVVLSSSDVDGAVDTLVAGSCDPNILAMVYIYLACGIFNKAMDEIGGGEAVVTLAVNSTPTWAVLPGVFVAATLVGVALGTSMGTIKSLVPIVRRIAVVTKAPAAPLVGAVLSGATCGDNLSVISDTAIAACSSQGAGRYEKMWLNLYVAVPAFCATLGTLACMQPATFTDADQLMNRKLLPILPYFWTLGTAALGLNVLGVLVTGVALAYTIGFATQGIGFTARMASLAFEGMEGELDIILLAVFTGGLSRLANEDGVLSKLFSIEGAGSPLRGEITLALLVALADVLCANNTVAIVIVGSIARELATSHGVSPARAANVLDIWSCITQGLIPHGAQLLTAGQPSIHGSAVTPWQLMLHSHYAFYLALFTCAWMCRAYFQPSAHAKAE